MIGSQLPSVFQIFDVSSWALQLKTFFSCLQAFVESKKYFKVLKTYWQSYKSKIPTTIKYLCLFPGFRPYSSKQNTCSRNKDWVQRAAFSGCTSEKEILDHSISVDLIPPRIRKPVCPWQRIGSVRSPWKARTGRWPRVHPENSD